eukprot:8219580-Pyramimonas_sp.AAC.1
MQGPRLGPVSSDARVCRIQLLSVGHNVVKLASRPREEQLSGKMAYPGAFLQLYAHGIKPAQCLKVAAHKVTDESGVDAV